MPLSAQGAQPRVAAREFSSMHSRRCAILVQTTHSSIKRARLRRYCRARVILLHPDMRDEPWHRNAEVRQLIRRTPECRLTLGDDASLTRADNFAVHALISQPPGLVLFDIK